MQAVFQMGGHQFSAQEGDILRVPLRKDKVGTKFDIEEILLVKDGETATIGTPTVEGAKIEAEMIADGKGDKVTVFKFKRRTKYRKMTGHRQPYSEIKINKIVAPKK